MGSRHRDRTLGRASVDLKLCGVCQVALTQHLGGSEGLPGFALSAQLDHPAQPQRGLRVTGATYRAGPAKVLQLASDDELRRHRRTLGAGFHSPHFGRLGGQNGIRLKAAGDRLLQTRSEEHTSELQSLMRISYAVFCLQKKHTQKTTKSK